MEKKQRLFIYDRKELIVLLLLGVMVAFFAFTLGVHLGKKVGIKPVAHAPAPEATGIASAPDQVPSKQELQEQAKAVTDQTVEDSVGQALHDEIARTGIHLDHGKQVALPDHVKSAKSKTLPAPASEDEAPAEKPAPASTHAAVSSAAHWFALQIGSYPSEKDARERVSTLQGSGISPYVQAAEVKGKKWFRVYVGSFSSKEEASKAGEKLKSSHVIDAFVLARVAKSAE